LTPAYSRDTALYTWQCAAGYASSATSPTVRLTVSFVPAAGGWVTDGPGLPTCAACPAGSSSSSGDACVACPPGSISASAGSTSCTPCAAGLGSSANRTVCVACTGSTALIGGVCRYPVAPATDALV
jgi:hypothetical protein